MADFFETVIAKLRYGWPFRYRGYHTELDRTLRQLDGSPMHGFGLDVIQSSGLAQGILAGAYANATGTISRSAYTVVTLAPSSTNYVEVDPATGAVTTTAVGFTVGRLPLWIIVCDPTKPTSYTDYRAVGAPASGGTSIQRVALVTGVLLDGATEEGTVALGVDAEVLRVSSAAGCWVRIYASSQHRVADTGRGINVDPTTPVLLEFIVPANLIYYPAVIPRVKVSDDVFTFPNPTQTATLFYRVTNISGAAQALTVNLDVRRS